jgi:3-oxoacyl-(acyl-carrier-protein) synthase
LEHTWIGSDSTGLIAIDESTDSLRHGLTACLLGGGSEAPAFVHAHATGTAHDAYELAAIRAACGQSPEVFSHKAFLGHTLGAAGLVSLVLSAQCHAHRTTLLGTPISPDATSLTIAQGFGGHIALARLRGL